MQRELDLLREHNKILTKRVQSLRTENGPLMRLGFMRSKSTEELKSVQSVVAEELGRKIQENEQLHVLNDDLKETVSQLQQTVKLQQESLHRCELELKQQKETNNGTHVQLKIIQQELEKRHAELNGISKSQQQTLLQSLGATLVAVGELESMNDIAILR